MTTNIKKFKAGKTYSCRSICDHDCIFEFKVVRRSAKSIWITNSMLEGVCRRSISIYDNQEIVHPYGKYSMSPTIRGDE